MALSSPHRRRATDKLRVVSVCRPALSGRRNGHETESVSIDLLCHTSPKTNYIYSEDSSAGVGQALGAESNSTSGLDRGHRGSHDRRVQAQIE
ncbi:hypothetical protein EVAR_35347_1 [Eumeta japonica]|uniref:Uncharacterized protein n=1 Tax=Eumeta variegata TaxID=151549 RepID=A0A4C1XMF4_EUMVA|nr:hypothetical protein EVAR_35347_1 [Eumeta japonica]